MEKNIYVHNIKLNERKSLFTPVSLSQGRRRDRPLIQGKT